jgi:hypothetical protein
LVVAGRTHISPKALNGGLIANAACAADRTDVNHKCEDLPKLRQIFRPSLTMVVKTPGTDMREAPEPPAPLPSHQS